MFMDEKSWETRNGLSNADTIIEISNSVNTKYEAPIQRAVYSLHTILCPIHIVICFCEGVGITIIPCF